MSPGRTSVPDAAAGDEVPLIWRDGSERVESDGEVEVAGMEIDEVSERPR
jgi:hypothetical protein